MYFCQRSTSCLHAHLAASLMLLSSRSLVKLPSRAPAISSVFSRFPEAGNDHSGFMRPTMDPQIRCEYIAFEAPPRVDLQDSWVHGTGTTFKASSLATVPATASQTRKFLLKLVRGIYELRTVPNALTYPKFKRAQELVAQVSSKLTSCRHTMQAMGSLNYPQQ